MLICPTQWARNRQLRQQRNKNRKRHPRVTAPQFIALVRTDWMTLWRRYKRCSHSGPLHGGVGPYSHPASTLRLHNPLPLEFRGGGVLGPFFILQWTRKLLLLTPLKLSVNHKLFFGTRMLKLRCSYRTLRRLMYLILVKTLKLSIKYKPINLFLDRGYSS